MPLTLDRNLFQSVLCVRTEECCEGERDRHHSEAVARARVQLPDSPGAQP